MHRDLGAYGGKLAGDLSANAARGPGYQNFFAIKTHGGQA
tara:strand:+ start:48 stop:167 length:120 start_codon:yes stop_codon:yes gene_type:complete